MKVTNQFTMLGKNVITVDEPITIGKENYLIVGDKKYEIEEVRMRNNAFILKTNDNDLVGKEVKII